MVNIFSVFVGILLFSGCIFACIVPAIAVLTLLYRIFTDKTITSDSNGFGRVLVFIGVLVTLIACYGYEGAHLKVSTPTAIYSAVSKEHNEFVLGSTVLNGVDYYVFNEISSYGTLEYKTL